MMVSEMCCLGEMVVVVALGADAKSCPKQTGMLEAAGQGCERLV